MIDSGVASGFYTKATFEHFHVRLPFLGLPMYFLGPPRQFPMLSPSHPDAEARTFAL